MKNISAISINGEEIPGHVEEELEDHEISTHYADNVIRISRSRFPLMWNWLKNAGYIPEFEESVTCIIFGT